MRARDATRDEQFRSYVSHSRGKLLRTAALLCAGDGHLAEDLVQTTLLRVYLAWPKIRADSRDTYARRILINAHLDERRRPAARFEHAHAHPPDVAVEDPLPPGSQHPVFRALAELAPRMRAAIVLRHLHDASVAETASVLGCSEGTVKSQTARELAQLRAALPELSVDQTVDATRGRMSEEEISND